MTSSLQLESAVSGGTHGQADLVEAESAEAEDMGGRAVDNGRSVAQARHLSAASALSLPDTPTLDTPTRLERSAAPITNGRPRNGHAGTVSLGTNGAGTVTLAPQPRPAEFPSPQAPVASALNPRLTPKRLRNRMVLADTVTTSAATALALVLMIAFRPIRSTVVLQHLVLSVITVPVLIGSLAANKLYLARFVERAEEELKRLWGACAFGIVITVAVAFAFQLRAVSRFWVLAVLFSVGTALTIERTIARSVFQRLRARGKISRRVAVIGTDTHAIHLIHTLQQQPALGYSVVGFFGDEFVGDRGGCEQLGGLADAEAMLDEYRCSGAIISLSSVPHDEVNRLSRKLTDRGFHVTLSSSLRDINISRIRPQGVDGRTMLYIEPTIRHGWRAKAKLVFDKAFAFVALLFSLPILLAAAIAIKLDSRGSIFFRQQRIGKDGRPFEMLKLRTMVTDAEERRHALLELNECDGPLFKIESDPRITRVGRFLRRSSIDELPQFINVLVGQMSVVGPRPALHHELKAWSDADHDPADEYADEVIERLRVLPGITGLWQVEGRSDASFDSYKRLDLFYVDNWSLLHDVRIVFKTVAAVALRRGAK